MNAIPITGRRQRRPGAAAVEFAVVLPILLIILIGLIDISCMLMTQSAMSHAARDGARKCVIDGATDSSGIHAVQQQLKHFGINEAIVDISPKPSQTVLGSPIVVQVEVPFEHASWLRKASPFRSVRLQSQAVMRSERVN